MSWPRPVERQAEWNAGIQGRLRLLFLLESRQRIGLNAQTASFATPEDEGHILPKRLSKNVQARLLEASEHQVRFGLVLLGGSEYPFPGVTLSQVVQS